ncbi:hypothetical protein [Streptomyces sp. 058-1L]
MTRATSDSRSTSTGEGRRTDFDDHEGGGLHYEQAQTGWLTTRA